MISVFFIVEETLTSIRFGNFEAVLAEDEDYDAIIDTIENNEEDEEEESPAELHNLFNRPKASVIDINRNAENILQATEKLNEVDISVGKVK